MIYETLRGGHVTLLGLSDCVKKNLTKTIQRQNMPG